MSRRELSEILLEMDSVLASASEEQIAVAVERLRANYPEWDELSEPVLEMVLSDMLDDLKDFPHTLLVEACKRWRNSEAKRAPTAGQLKATVKDDLKRLGLIRVMAVEALNIVGTA